MIYESFKTFKMKLLKCFSNEIIECNHKITEYTVDLHSLSTTFLVKDMRWMVINLMLKNF